MKRRGTICILLLGLILITATACGSNDKETTSQLPTESDTNVTITADGNIKALFHERLTFGSGGKVSEIAVKEGDRVSKGDVLARLDTGALELAEAQAQVALTEAKLALTQAKLAQIQAKVATEEAEYNLNYLRNVLRASQAQVEIAESQLEAAKESVEYAKQNVNLAQQNVDLAQKSLVQARKDLREATIVAPFDGIVSKIGVKEGEFLSPAAYTGTIIVELIDPRHMELTARVDELDIVRVKTGQKVMISVDAMPGTKLEGRVTFISPVAREPVGVVLFEDEDEEKSYEVKIDFDIPGNSPIRAGMSATAEIIVE